MKKIIIFALSIFFLVGLVGCSPSTNAPTSETDASGNIFTTSSIEQTIQIKAFPVTIAYNDSSIVLTNVDFYETTPNNSFVLFAVVEFDVSNLGDSELQWLLENDISISSLLTSDPNSLKNDFMDLLGSLWIADENKLYYVFTSSFMEEYRYSFEAAEIFLSVEIEQEKTYTRETSTGEYEDHYKVRASSFFPVPSPIQDAENIPAPLYNYVVQWLQEEANFYAGLG